ncbi:MAG: methyltransferase domain-containing protein [Candidatus Kuenenia sp.]|nr:methyltransferase domain-containing protein [Candidatus Kuenenia hertensis]
MKSTDLERTTKDYYNSSDADQFYYKIWGGEDIHIGIYKDENDSIYDASRRTIEKMASLLNGKQQGYKILDIGSGYGGAARYLAKKFNYTINCLNLSEQQNNRNRALNREQGLDKAVNVIDGSFEEIPFPDETFDVVWSCDAILHSGNKKKVLKEVHRVLINQGDFIFTDPMQSDDCPPGVLRTVLERIHLDSMGSFRFYKETLLSLGFEEVQIIDLTNQLITHYSKVYHELESRYEDIVNLSSQAYIDRMKEGLNNWVEAGEKGYLAWGILHFRKK